MIIGIALVRDEIELLPAVCAQLFRQGVDRLLIADHRSEDGTREWLLAAAEADPRIAAFRIDAPEFHQAAALTSLARTACGLGAEWVIPFDADEFWTATDGSTVSSVLRAQPAAVRAVRVEVRNYLADLATIEFSPATLLDVRFVSPTPGDARPAPPDPRVASLEYPFVLVPFQSKTIPRAAPTLRVLAGGHQSMVDGALLPPADSGELLCAHLPFRSRRHLDRRARDGEVIRASGYPPGHSWQAQAIADLSRQGRLDEWWRANASDAGRITCAGTEYPLVPDDTVRDAYLAVQGHALCSLPVQSRENRPGELEAPCTVAEAALESARSLALDAEVSARREAESALESQQLRAILQQRDEQRVALDAELAAGRAELTTVREELAASRVDLDATRFEADEAHAAWAGAHDAAMTVAAEAAARREELDRVRVELDEMRASRSWRVTKVVRKVSPALGGLRPR